ncbi:MAG TPA: diacylglycerol kinase family protein [Solirubrobacteraceae bacterium]|jgi:YegS/Rv2252/BmrU family lipid kinase|nr:diacylglycerol kinase family protein [Solirubrobacteraceae bacterium]
MPRRLSLIVNPSAGNGRAARLLPRAEAALRRLEVDFHVETTTDLDHARELARAAVAADEPAVALSGDGLIGAIAGELQDGPGVLGVLPGGRGNDFARVLGIPHDVEAACAVVAAGAQRSVDVGDVDGRPFIGVASVGCDSEANRIANQTRLVRGNVVYAYGALRALATWTPAHFTLDLDGGRRITFSGYSVAAANSRAYGGGMFIAPEAELDDGMLDVVCSGQATKRRALLNLTRVFQGRHVEAPWVHVLRSREVTVSCDRPFTMYADGDPIGELPLTVRARHRALQVIVPE